MDEGKLSLESKDIAAERRQEMLRLFPEARTEGGKIDFDQLKRALGESVDTGKERYGMNWPGKANCFRLIQSPSTATLLPAREESVRFDETENMIIEGDNLEVLKLLQKGYQNKVKMIYIDPPYNTGNDFIYPDDFADNLKNYLQYTGQADVEGKKFSNNPESDGRFHSNWLNLMYPRLYLARNLLREDGVLFVSIDEGEFPALLDLMNSIYGETNRIGVIVWKGATDNNPTRIAIEHEYVVCYARDKSKTSGVWRGLDGGGKKELLDEFNRLRQLYGSNDEAIQVEVRSYIKRNKLSLAGLTHYDRVDSGGLYTGSRKVHNPKPGGYVYDVPHPKNGKACVPPVNGYRFPPETMKQLLNSDKVLFGEDENQIIQIKQYLDEFESKLGSVIELDSRSGANELVATFGIQKLFPGPKPTRLLNTIYEFIVRDGDIVLDFFAGSGSTAEAILQLNKELKSPASFILVQLPEPTGREDYKTIADITKERVRRVVQRYDKEADGKLDLQLEGDSRLQEGFRVFKLAPSNFKVWDVHTDEGIAGVERQMELAVNHIMPERTAEDLFYEILMKSEYPLTAKVENFDAAGIKAFSVEDDALIVCVERKVTAEAVAAIAKRSPSKVIFLDEAFSGNDQLKANAKMNFESAGVKRFETV